ncbi:MAG: RNA polymerase sigma factor [Candidatus Firestonebacteria bacterium]
MPLEDAIYIEQCKNGDSSGFYNLVNKYKDLIFAVILQRNIDRNNAEDLTQEVFVKAYYSLPKLKNSDKFAGWLYGIAYHTSIDWIRKRKKERTVSIEQVPNLNLGNDQQDADEEQKERMKTLHEELQELPEETKSILMLRYIDEFSYEKISSVLNLPISTVETRLYRARQLLRARMTKRECA